MGIVSVEKVNHLFWLGRYTERVFTTLKTFDRYFDVMLDQEPDIYQKFCRRLAIPDIYRDMEDFIDRYLYDAENPDSLYANLVRAYDNAVVMREELSSEVLAYIQLALDVLKGSRSARAPIVELQRVADYLLAFWGSADDYVESEESRNLMKCGKYVERLDLYLRFGMDGEQLDKEFSKLLNRLNRVHVRRNLEKMDRLTEIIQKGDGWKEHIQEAVTLAGEIVEV